VSHQLAVFLSQHFFYTDKKTSTHRDVGVLFFSKFGAIPFFGAMGTAFPRVALTAFFRAFVPGSIP
jgi:hypothetical protein